ncbi:MAG: sugar transferase [Desulfobacula sp.]|nr:sugar transferase [Desulfobacula sp.]
MKVKIKMKRVFDLFFSLLLSVLFFPVFLIVGILVRLILGKPIIFCQKRPGFQGRPFTIYKFRSMTDQRDKKGRLLPDDLRFNRFSHFLRKSSLDELPELINVIKGDMSLVGPRPLLIQYLERYNSEQARRHEVKPGITGWAQVNGRNAISWEDKFKLDVWYVDQLNLWLDLKILLMTVVHLFKQDGIHQEGHVTAKEFMGNKKQ